MLISRKCEVCGEVFMPNTYRQKYCSEPCRRKVKRKQSLEWYYANKGRKAGIKYPCTGMKWDFPEEMCLDCKAEECRFNKKDEQ